MDKRLAEVVTKIGNEFRDSILVDSRFYLEVDIGKQAAQYGHSDLAEKYQGKYAVIPLRKPLRGMKVRIDGRTFINYAQFDSGVVVPAYVAMDTGLTFKTFIPQDSMICNYT